MFRFPLILCVALAVAVAWGRPAAAEPTLVGLAVLPADTFEPADDPAAHRSGQFIQAKNGRSVPFATQPIQGISSVVAGDAPGTFLGLSDNGYGTKANSADFVLSIYRITPHFQTGGGENRTEKPAENGTVDAAVAFRLRDPDHKVPWPIVADAATYPHSDLPVPASIREGRLLTGADFDVESFVRLGDGSFWIGDEFGPFLLHVSADGKLLEPPVELPGEGMHSPDHPTKDPATAKVKRSGGFEGLAHPTRVPDAPHLLVPILEKPVDGESALRTFAFQLAPGLRVGESDEGFPKYVGLPGRYPLPKEATSIGEFTADPAAGIPRRYFVLERDNAEGDKATHKKITLAHERIPIDGTLLRTEIADLLNLADPRDLDGDGRDRFRFPYLTIESVLPVDERTLLVINDNNYPFGNGRSATEPDATELILIRFDRPLAELGSD